MKFHDEIRRMLFLTYKKNPKLRLGHETRKDTMQNNRYISFYISFRRIVLGSFTNMNLSIEEDGSRFVASTVHLDHITTALNCLTSFDKTEDVLIYIDRDGLSFVRESNHVIKMQLLLARELFMSYSYNDRDDSEDETDSDVETTQVSKDKYMKLCVKINHLLDSVNIMNKSFDDVVECTLSYDGTGSPFVLMFEDSLISERVEYKTYVIKNMDNAGLILDKDHMIFECIVKGDVLYSALKDLKEINCKECYIYAKTLDSGENIFAFISKTQMGYSKIVIPNSRSILEKLEIYKDDSTTLCYNVPVIGYFDFATFDKIRLSTKIASKVLFRMDVNGLLSVNVLSQTDDILLSDNNKSKDKSKKAKSGRKNTTELPNDYPGIVCEICLLEREMIEQDVQDEIEMFMNIDESGVLKRKNIMPTPRYLNPVENEDTYSNTSSVFQNSNILNLSSEQTEIVSRNFVDSKKSENSTVDVMKPGDNEDDDDDINNDEHDKTNSSVAYGTGEIPLFF